MVGGGCYAVEGVLPRATALSSGVSGCPISTYCLEQGLIGWQAEREGNWSRGVPPRLQPLSSRVSE